MKILQYKGVGSPSEYTQNGVRLTLQVQVSVFLGTLSGQCIKHAETGPEHRWIATSPNWALAWLVLRPKSALPGQDGHLGPMALKLLVAIWLGTPSSGNLGIQIQKSKFFWNFRIKFSVLQLNYYWELNSIWN